MMNVYALGTNDVEEATRWISEDGTDWFAVSRWMILHGDWLIRPIEDLPTSGMLHYRDIQGGMHHQEAGP